MLELEHEETLRPGVEQLIRNLSERGFECWILSGDASDRVERVARRLGIPRKQALGDQTPEEKARIVDRLDRGDTLYLGDGINDLPAFRRVLLAGSPPTEAPVVPGRSDFFLLGPGLHGLEELISEAHSLGRLERQLLASSVLYNVGTVAIAAQLDLAVIGSIPDASQLAVVDCAGALVAPWPLGELQDGLRRALAYLGGSCMILLALPIFVSFVLVLGALLLYIHTVRASTFDQAERLALLPLEPDTFDSEENQKDAFLSHGGNHGTQTPDH